MNCPKCDSEVMVESPCLGNIPLDHCMGCGGIWFDKDELEALLKQSQGWGSADFNLIDPKASELDCPRCKNKLTHGGLVNPLLVVEKCPACGGTWLDARELDLVKKQLGLSGGPSEVSGLTRPPEAPVAAVEPRAPIRIVPLICAVLGFIGLSCEIYLYYSPTGHLPFLESMGWSLYGTIISFVVFGLGFFALNRGEHKK